MSKTPAKKLIPLLLLTFTFAGVIGFLYETVCVMINTGGEFYKRGTTYGPWIPIYGFGALFLTLAVFKRKVSPLLVFVITCIGSFIIEFTTGYVLYHYFGGMRLWDYNVEIWNWGNIGGYVCFRSVAIFGILGILFAKWAIPGLFKITDTAPRRKLLAFFIPLAVIFFGDILINYILIPFVFK